MDPVLLPTLFNVLDLLESKSMPVTLDDLNFKQRVTERRFAEIGRVLEGFQVAHREGKMFVPDADLKTFVTYWEDVNLEGINSVFSRYSPYARFLDFIDRNRYICIPPKSDTAARRLIGEKLRKEKTGLTYVAIDTFKWWGMVVGQVYFSHIGDRNIYWGGENPNIDTFDRSVRSHYREIRPIDGFANVGQLADRVCRDLKISFVRFEDLFTSLCLRKKGFVSSTSLVRTPSSKSSVQTLLSRSQAKQNGYPVEWTVKRFMEDGVIINGRSVKMVKFPQVNQLGFQGGPNE